MAAEMEGVFINVPFDVRYKKLFDALVFTVHECGFNARCSLEADDGSESRLEKLYRIIGECPLAIHDISRVTLDTQNRLPRFNMPLELGIFLGAKRFGSPEQQLKACVILERDRYRFQRFCSDLAGTDIKGHGNDVGRAIAAVRGFLRAARPTGAMTGAAQIASRYLQFRLDLPRMCESQDLVVPELSFPEYRLMIRAWQKANS